MSKFPGDASSPCALPQLPRVTGVLLDLQDGQRRFHGVPVGLPCDTETMKVLAENVDGSISVYDVGVDKVLGIKSKSRIHKGKMIDQLNHLMTKYSLPLHKLQGKSVDSK